MKMFWFMMILMGMLVVGAIVAAVDPDVLDEPTVTPTATVESENNALPKAYLGEDGYYYIDVIMVDYDGVEHIRKVVVIPYEEDDGSVRYFMPTPTPTPELS